MGLKTVCLFGEYSGDAKFYKVNFLLCSYVDY